MKKRYLVVGLVALAMQGKPQAMDSAYKKQDLSKTDIELVYSQYAQDGDHSAVTGGSGTEKLNVYAPGFSLSHKKARNTFTLAGGADIVSSASTDRIDSIISSASKMDTRSYANIQYSHALGKKGVELGIGTGISIESDYLSIPARAFLNYAEPSGMRTYQAAFEVFFDDLRWGRLNPDYRRPVTLVYPAELRYKEWYDVYKRYSYNLKTGFTQVINKRLVAGVFPELIYQHGLLATPFHRVYFTDESLKVENLPKDRIRTPITLRANYFAGGRTILKGQYGFYRDNFGITANFIDFEGAFKVSPRITLTPFVRLYSQSGSDYFMPYGNHNPQSAYYSSDYDLSEFNSIKTGIGFRYAPQSSVFGQMRLNEINVRYAYFQRNDSLSAHMITVVFALSKAGKRKTQQHLKGQGSAIE